MTKVGNASYQNPRGEWVGQEDEVEEYGSVGGAGGDWAKYRWNVEGKLWTGIGEGEEVSE